MRAQSPTTQGRGTFVYVLFLASLVSLLAIGAWFLLIMITVGVERMDAEFSGDLRWFSSPASTGIIISLGFAFIASLVSLGAAWKILRDGPTAGALITIAAFQVVTVGVFHYWHSLIPAIPAVVAIYGLTVARTPSGARNLDVLRVAFQSAAAQGAPETVASVRQVDHIDDPDGQPIVCPACRAENLSDACFCFNCGSPIASVVS